MKCHFPEDDLYNLLTLSHLWLKVVIGLVKGSIPEVIKECLLYHLTGLRPRLIHLQLLTSFFLQRRTIYFVRLQKKGFRST